MQQHWKRWCAQQVPLGVRGGLSAQGWAERRGPGASCKATLTAAEGVNRCAISLKSCKASSAARRTAVPPVLPDWRMLAIGGAGGWLLLHLLGVFGV